MPDKKRKQETRVHRKTLNPIFNETFKFEVSTTKNPFEWNKILKFKSLKMPLDGVIELCKF